MNEIIELIKALIENLGFPIAMCVYFIWDKTKSQAQTNDILKSMNDTLVVIKEYIEHTTDCGK